MIQIKNVRQEGSFVRHVSVATGWNVAIAATQFVLTPVVTRLYTPAQYGVFALLNSMIVSISLLSSFKYSESILITETREMRDRASVLAFVILHVVALVVLGNIFIFHHAVSGFLNLPETSLLPYIIPIGVLLTGYLEILVNVNTNLKKYFQNGISGFLNGLSARGVNILTAIVSESMVVGLMVGDFCGKVVAVASLLFSLKNPVEALKALRSSCKTSLLLATAKLYKSFPLYSLPTSFLITLSGHLPLYFFQIQYGSLIVGSFALASSLLEIINRLIPYSVSAIFLQKAKDLKNESMTRLADTVYKLFIYVLLLATGIFISISLLSTTVLPWAFGENWLAAGTIASVLALHYTFNFVTISLSEVYRVMDRQQLLLGTSMLSVFLKIASIGALMILDLELITGLLLFSLASSIGSIIQVLGVFFILQHYFIKALLFIFISFVLVGSVILLSVVI